MSKTAVAVTLLLTFVLGILLFAANGRVPIVESTQWRNTQADRSAHGAQANAKPKANEPGITIVRSTAEQAANSALPTNVGEPVRSPENRPSPAMHTAEAGEQMLSDELAPESLQNPRWKSLPVLSPQWTESFMMICTTTMFGDCTKTRDFAVRVAGEPKGEDDSWPHRLEYELNDYFSLISSANAIDSFHIKCSPHGCLAFFTGDRRKIFGEGELSWQPFWRDLHRQPWIEEFAVTRDSGSPKARGRAAGFFSTTRQPFGMLLVFARKTASGAGKSLGQRGVVGRSDMVASRTHQLTALQAVNTIGSTTETTI